MLLMLEDRHKEHLIFLSTVSMDVLQEFCRISLEFIRKGTNAKVYQSAAQKLGVDAETIQNGVEGIMYLLVESSKLMLSERDFTESVLAGLGGAGGTELCGVLCASYLEHRAELRAVLAGMAGDAATTPQYHNLHWRLDVQLGSRSLHHQMTPLVLLKLATKSGDGADTVLLQTDPVNLLHLTNTLDEALKEMKTAHCRRIVRNI